MHDPAELADSVARLERQVRWLKRYALLTVVGALVVLAAGFRHERRGRFTELDVERLNVRTPDGRMAVAIATDDRLPGNIMHGHERRTGNRGNGLIFYDTKGNEAGGLTFHADTRVDGSDTTVNAFGQLSLDRFESDQVVAMRYLEEPGYGWGAGLQVSHFPLHVTAEWLAAQDSVDHLPAPAQPAARRAVRAEFMRAGKWEVPRVFVGERGRTAAIQLRDTRGRERIRLVVDSADVARIELLDSAGAVVSRLPQ